MPFRGSRTVTVVSGPSVHRTGHGGRGAGIRGWCESCPGCTTRGPSLWRAPR